MLGEKHQHQHFTRNQIRARHWAGTLISAVASASGWEEIYICIRSIWIQEESRCLVNFHILSVLSPRPYKTRQLKCSWHLAGSASTPHGKGWEAHPGWERPERSWGARRDRAGMGTGTAVWHPLGGHREGSPWGGTKAQNTETHILRSESQEARKPGECPVFYQPSVEPKQIAGSVECNRIYLLNKPSRTDTCQHAIRS